MNGLLIKEEWLEKILRGEKTWEIRGARTKIRSPIALIKSKSGHIFGTCNVIDVVGPLSKAELERTVGKHRIPLADLRKGLRYEKPYAWVLDSVKPLKKPVPYKHPSGAQMWVKLPDSLTRRLA